VIWHKVWYDLWHNKLRTLLVIISIAVGVFAVGVTFGLTGQMLPSMDAAHRSTQPSHVTMFTLRPVDRDTILALRKIPSVVNLEPLNSVEVRYKKYPQDSWHKGSILMRDDYANQIYDVVQLKEGVWPEEDFLGIERMHSPFYGIDIGDQVILEVGDQEKSFQITSKIRHPFVPPPSMYDQAWFFSSENIMELYGIPRGQFTQFKFSVTPYTALQARLVASAIKERLAKQGIGIAATMYQDPEKHWGRAFVDGMTLVIEILAVLSMLLSVVLVLNTLTAVITQQTNQIGIMKAIGGTSSTVLKAYLVGVFVYGLLALGVALPLGSIASFSMTRWFLGMYNIEYDLFTFSKQAVIYQAAAALVIPILAALVPVLEGARMTVRQAIASYGLGGDFGSSWIDRAIERIARQFLISYNAMAVANIFRRKGRLILTQLVLITAGVMFLMVLSLSSSLKATMDTDFARRTYDMDFYLSDLQRVDLMTDMIEDVPGVEHADMWLVAPATILHQGQRSIDAGMGSQLQGMPVNEPMYRPPIVEGRWFGPGDDRVIVMQRDTAEKENIKVGDAVILDLGEWGKDDWTVIGLYQVFMMLGGGYSVDIMYAPRPAVFEATKKEGKGTILLVRTNKHTPEAVNEAKSQIETLLKHRHIDVFQTETMPELRKIYDTSFSMVIGMLMALAILVAVVGGIGLMGSLSIGVIERTKEIGMMRALGALSRNILGMFVLEGILQGLISWIVAVPLSMVVAPKLADALALTMFQSKMDYMFNYPAALIWLAVILVISVLASLIPARNAARINVRQSLSYE
jgi:putative ABC transport system permease protein